MSKGAGKERRRSENKEGRRGTQDKTKRRRKGWKEGWKKVVRKQR